MGRRKIEIRAIRDDRNRSVTFLKRKGGLFKKAYELGVLCSVDVAVIVFGNNKKLYQFSSGDMNEVLNRYQYHAGAPHEHKGPADFQGKGGDWEDEDEDQDLPTEISPPVSHMHDTPEPAQPAHHLHRQAPYQHVRQFTASTSASPPMRNVNLRRSMTPQSQTYSRPGSRMAAAPARTGSSMSVTQQHHYSHPPPPTLPPPDYYTSQPHYGGPQIAPIRSPQPPMHSPYPPHVPSHAQRAQAHAQAQAQAHYAYAQAESQSPPANQHQYHMHRAYSDDQRHRSVTPSAPPSHHYDDPRQYPPPARSLPQLGVQTNTFDRKPSPQMSNASAQSDSLLQPKALAPQNSTHSIFTPIDDSRSLLAQHWGGPPTSADIARARSSDGTRPPSNSRSIHMSPPADMIDPRIARGGRPHERSRSLSRSTSPPPKAAPMTRSSTQQSEKKPRLKVQIPGEQSDTGGDSAVETSVAVSTVPTAAAPHQQAKAVVLPPPSPSARNPQLSAGATGPYNPFAFVKPQIPANNSLSSSTINNNLHHGNATLPGREPLETPLSALPSRAMDGNMLPSPSDIWHSVWSKQVGDNMMPSPINFQNTPIYSAGVGFRELAPEDRKRRAEVDAAGLHEKRIKT